jgi:predicted dehydrogenase
MRIRIGIAGAGFGAKAHLPALLSNPAFEVVALASPSSAAAIARERGIPHAFASTEEMLRGCELDAVTIASPPFTHRDDVLAVLDAGKHVMCEKPFALNVAESQEMLDASRRTGTACAVAHEFRWLPTRQALKELIVNNHLEPLREIEITQLSDFLRMQGTRERGWWFERERGGGLAGAMLSHYIDTATWFAGHPALRAVGFLRTANPKRHDESGEFASDVDDGAFAILDYGDGLVGRLSVDATTAQSSTTVAVHAENRTAVETGKTLTDTTLYSVDDEETSELACKPSRYARFARLYPSVPYLMELYDEFVNAIERKPHALPTFAEAVETQKVLAAIGYSFARSYATKL